MSEVLNIKENVTHYINEMIFRARLLSDAFKRSGFGERNNGRDLIEEMIVIGYCTMYFSDMNESDLEEIVGSTLEYFKTGLYDTDKTTGTARTNVPTHTANVDKSSFEIRAWVYTPDTHNDAGEWFCVYTFEKSEDAQKCITMLKKIEAELKRLY